MPENRLELLTTTPIAVTPVVAGFVANRAEPTFRLTKTHETRYTALRRQGKSGDSRPTRVLILHRSGGLSGYGSADIGRYTGFWRRWSCAVDIGCQATYYIL
jgi:hypothetical protein